MVEFSRGDLVKKVGSLYKLVVLASRRAVELNQGAQPLVEGAPGDKVVAIALREIFEGKVSLKIGK